MKACRMFLKEKYGNKRDIMYCRIKTFTALPVMKFKTVYDMREFRDIVSSPLLALQNLGRTVDTWNVLLAYIVTQKYRSRISEAVNLHLENSTNYPTHRQLHEFLTLKIRGVTKTPA